LFFRCESFCRTDSKFYIRAREVSEVSTWDRSGKFFYI